VAKTRSELEKKTATEVKNTSQQEEGERTPEGYRKFVYELKTKRKERVGKKERDHIQHEK